MLKEHGTPSKVAIFPISCMEEKHPKDTAR
jgi:hypothetical protein